MKQRYAYRILPCILSLFLASPVVSQVAIHGKITNPKNEVLTGVTIIEKGTTNGGVSNEDGIFLINVSGADATLIFSYVGYIPQEILLNGKSEVHVVLNEDVKQIDEVVIMGYSEKKKTELASAVTVVSAEQLNDIVASNIGAKLQGKVQGLQVVNSSGDPGAEPELRIRGVASLSAPKGPLYVVDGIIGGNYDPNDVESLRCYVMPVLPDCMDHRQTAA
jgi:hypothetical protein